MVVEWDGQGKPKRLMGIHLDISESKKYEEDLLIAKEQAEQGAKSKSEFLASMRHEIRTPMNGVLGMLSLLKKESLSIEQARKVSTAKNSAESLLTLINDILDFSKIEAGKIDLEIIDFNMLLLLEDLVAMMVFKAEEKGIEFILDTSDLEQELVKGDPGRIRQIITNLVGNAIKFTNEGEVILKVSNHRSESGGTCFHCKIIDSGIGIHEDQQKKLFEKFTQADASTTRKYGGTGLGLSISKSLCELMHGEIFVESELKKGSCFRFTLNLCDSEEASILIPRIDTKSLTFLLLIKNIKSRESLSNLLEKSGATVIAPSIEADGLAVLESYKGNEFDVGFVDIKLLDKTCDQAANDIRQELGLNDLKLVLMSSVKVPKTLSDVRQLGFDTYFNKPATLSSIFDSLAAMFKDSKKYHHIVQDYFDSQSHISELTTHAWPDKTRLLLVEDNQINQMVAKSMLQDMGLDADIAGDGQEALRQLKENQFEPYTLILMDCQMPVMDGYKATENIRMGEAGEIYKNIPIIAMTANAMQGDKEKCIRAGMSEYLSKPVDEDALRLMLERFLYEQKH